MASELLQKPAEPDAVEPAPATRACIRQAAEPSEPPSRSQQHRSEEAARPAPKTSRSRPKTVPAEEAVPAPPPEPAQRCAKAASPPAEPALPPSPLHRQWSL